MAKRLVSGIQPTGSLHLGNYLGAVKQWVELQDDYDSFFFIADYHTLSIRPKREVLKQNILDLVASLIALGVDPKSATLFRQSDVIEQAELAIILNNFTTVGQLNRMTQFKEKSDQFGQNVGLLTYPVLQTADVAAYGGEVVPVGEDQVQHLELSREIVRCFNNHVGQAVLVEPKPLLTKAARVMALNNPTKKMAKSVPGSAISLLDNQQSIEQTLKRAVTDSDPNSSEMSPGVLNLFLLLESFSSAETANHFHKQHKDGTIRYSELKEQLTEDIVAFLEPIQKTYQSLMGDPAQLVTILEQGKRKAAPVAEQTLKKVRLSLGLA